MKETNRVIAATQRMKECNRTAGLSGQAARKKKMWLGGLCLGFSVALTACGTGGSFQEQAVTVIQSAQETQDARETASVRDEQSAGNAQNEQSAGSAQGEQSVGKARNQQEAAGTQAYEALKERVLAEMTDEQKNWMGGLSGEQRLADFESLCEGLRNNYPYVELAKRQAGADLDALEIEYQSKVEQCANDDAYFEILLDFVGEFSGMGHLELWGRRYEWELASMRKAAKEPENRERLEPYVDALDNPVSYRTYASMTKYYQDVECRLEEKRADEGGGDRGESAGAEANVVEEAKTKLNREEAADGDRRLQKDTAGDGSGTDLAYLILPNSGLVVQYSRDLPQIDREEAR